PPLGVPLFLCGANEAPRLRGLRRSAPTASPPSRSDGGPPSTNVSIPSERSARRGGARAARAKGDAAHGLGVVDRAAPARRDLGQGLEAALQLRAARGVESDEAHARAV